jgi:hypothetical protein
MRNLLFVVTAASIVSLATLACGGTDSSIASNITPAGDAGPERTTSPTESPDGSVDPTPQPGPEAGVPDDRIDPIALGRSWTYDVTIIGTYPICRAGSSTGQVLGTKQVSGKQAFQVQSFCPGAGTTSYAVDGDRVELFYANTWILALDAPVEEGHTWTNGADDFVWEKAPKVTGKAGTFDDCWTARQENSESYTVFCRGVGPVKWHFVDKGNGYDAVLTAKNF